MELDHGHRFRTESLSQPLTRQELAQLQARRNRGEFGAAPRVAGQVFLVVLTVVVMVGFAAALVLPQLLTSMEGGFTRRDIFIVIWLASLAFTLFRLLRGGVRSVTGRQHWATLARFADQNDLTLRLRSAQPSYPGLLFSQGDSRASTMHVYSQQGPLADAGTFSYVTGDGNNRQTHIWGYAAFRLPRAMPHLLLDAKANNRAGLTNLPTVYASSQRVSLSAPFDDHYTLYAPDGYGQDAFYLFPAHVIEKLIGAPANYDIEIIDTWMFFYTQSPQDLTDPATWQVFESICDTVVEQMSRLSDRYRDHHGDLVLASEAPVARQGDPGQSVGEIAEQGRRLRGGFDVRVVVSLVAMVALWFVFHHLLN